MTATSTTTLFPGGHHLAAAAEGRADFTPVFFSEIPSVLEEILHPNVAMIQVSPPDEHGYVSLGVSVDYTKTAAEVADLVIAQVNKQMPLHLGGCFPPRHPAGLHRGDRPARHRAGTPQDPGRSGASARTWPNSSGTATPFSWASAPSPTPSSPLPEGRRMTWASTRRCSPTAWWRLVEAYKYHQPERRPSTGARAWPPSSWAPAASMTTWTTTLPWPCTPCSTSTTPYVIAQNDNLVSINSCVQIDIMGRWCPPPCQPGQISGVGGPDRLRPGGPMSKGGRAHGHASTTGGGKISKIVPFLDQGPAVTTSRNDVNYVVTEYGIAQLRGKNLRQGAEEPSPSPTPTSGMNCGLSSAAGIPETTNPNHPPKKVEVLSHDPI